MKMIRLTRHGLVSGQQDDIKRIWGDIELEKNFHILPTNKKDAVKEFDFIMRDADVAEIVLPIDLIEAILKYSVFCRRGGILVKASMEKLDSGKYSFCNYDQLINVEIQTRRL